MKKRLILMTAIVAVLISGCGSSTFTNRIDTNVNTKYQMLLNSGSCFVYTFEDEATGVWYISNGDGVTPRLNADGSLYTE